MTVHALIALLVLPPVLLGGISLLIVRRRLGPAYAVRNTARRNGSDVAEVILAKQFPVDTCRVASFDGRSFDHYSPSSHCMSLHTSHHSDNTVAAVAVAAHQAGIASLCEENVFGARMRQSLAPLTVITAQILPVGILLDLFLEEVAYLGVILAALYIVLALFQLATVRLELRAGEKAMQSLESLNFLTDAEMALARNAMVGIAWSYPASLISSWLNLHHVFVRAGHTPPKPDLPLPGTVKRERPRSLGTELFSKN